MTRWPSKKSVYSEGGSVILTEEFVVVMLDLKDDDARVIHGIELTTLINIDFDNDFVSGFVGIEMLMSMLASQSPTMRQISASRFRQFSQKLKDEAVAKQKKLAGVER
ncbi:unnamed protein product [Fraxinus pennsylvanica]|uniref:Uncharacterized protein n=1 Tax=Fraxinus pennsylvanica TaxID=56036 RepID=A0AAD2A9R3_9LAMI|nr:unnamed protein product [Fraxinus pennsylvanica]